MGVAADAIEGTTVKNQSTNIWTTIIDTYERYDVLSDIEVAVAVTLSNGDPDVRPSRHRRHGLTGTPAVP